MERESLEAKALARNVRKLGNGGAELSEWVLNAAEDCDEIVLLLKLFGPVSGPSQWSAFLKLLGLDQVGQGVTVQSRILCL